MNNILVFHYRRARALSLQPSFLVTEPTADAEIEMGTVHPPDIRPEKAWRASN